MESASSFDDSRRRTPLKELKGTDGVSYILGDQIGSGSSGGVYHSTRQPDGLEVAVKAIRVDRLRIAEEKKTLDREIGILRSLNYRSIVRLFDVVEDADYVYIVMEYVAGGELFGRITDDPAYKNEDVVKYLFVQVVEAVLYLHAHDVIHRDIKAENVLVSSSLSEPPTGDEDTPGLPAYPIVKLADFGLSKKVTDQSSLAMTWVGTPQYWASELLLARDTNTPYDGRVDIWSLGVLLYVTLGKRYPFPENSKSSPLPMNERIVRGIFDFSNTVRPVSRLAQDLIKKMIVPDPSGRLSLEEVLLHPWLANFPPAQRAAQIWAQGVVSVQSFAGAETLSRVDRGVRISSDESIETSLVPRPSTPPSSPPKSPPPPVTAAPPNPPILPNLALSSGLPIPLGELAHCQTEISRTLNKILLQFQDRPGTQRVAGDLLRRARDLHFLSARTISGFAITAESVEQVLLDAQAFVEGGAVKAAVECLEEVRGHVSEMHAQSQGVQAEYRRLAGDVHKLLSLAGVGGLGAVGATRGRGVSALLGARAGGEASRVGNDSGVGEVSKDDIGNGGIVGNSSEVIRRSNSSSSTSSLESVGAEGSPINGSPPPTPETRILLRRVAGGEVGGLSAEQQLDLMEILGLISLGRTVHDESAPELPLAPRSSTPPLSPPSEEFSLLSLAARDLRKVDGILERCRLFWSNVEHCVLRLNQFKDAGVRLLENARTSETVFQRYNQRMNLNLTFWAAFRSTCAEYAQRAQIEYQRAIDDAGKIADLVDNVRRAIDS